MNPGHSPRILLVTPPLTQLNTPYPAAAVLKGFLGKKGYIVRQADLGLELILDLFSIESLAEIFNNLQSGSGAENPALALRDDYLNTITDVIRFLQGRDPTLAHRIAYEGFLPEGPRFDNLEDMDWAFGSLGIQDRAKFMATQYLEDLADLIRRNISEHFGFSRYGEQLAAVAGRFEPVNEAVLSKDVLIDRIILTRLELQMKAFEPDIIGFSIPFPGCLIGALKCGHFIRQQFPNTVIVLGGGYINTELRSLNNPEIFQYTDFITLDDGEMPLLQIARLTAGDIDESQLVRTFRQIDGRVVYSDDQEAEPLPFILSSAPDYSDLMLDQYLSVTEIANPMHRIWSDGRWNKLALAHGCYWNKCAFCDVHLDYICRYDPLPTTEIVDRIEAIKSQTGQSGFHFVDEAAHPELLKEMALEILKRKLVITWWTNIRFEKRFSVDLCRLLAKSGCIAVAGGLETASDRLLKKMKKGVTISHAAEVTNNLQEAGILVHAYLMHGFPTQTEQETIDSLEIVRQFFRNGLIQSAFWHRFALTCHSSIGRNPEAYEISITGPDPGDFARNELTFEDAKGAEHDRFTKGLQKSVYNYMYGVGLEYDLAIWFDHEIPETTHSASLIESHLKHQFQADTPGF